MNIFVHILSSRVFILLAVSYSTLKDNLVKYFGKVADNNETVVVTGKDEKSVVIISMEDYNEMLKQINNAKYLAMLDLSISQMKSGQGTLHDLIEVGDE